MEEKTKSDGDERVSECRGEKRKRKKKGKKRDRGRLTFN